MSYFVPCFEISVTFDRYALDVNVERAEDVLTHKRLLHLAEDPANLPVFDVRIVQVYISATSIVYTLIIRVSI